jgi:hypothetical protein
MIAQRKKKMNNDLEPVLGKAWDVISFTINFMTHTYSKKEIIEYITKVDSLSYNELLMESLKILENK